MSMENSIINISSKQIKIKDICSCNSGDIIVFRGRLDRIRDQSKMIFLIMRDEGQTVQCILSKISNSNDEDYIKYHKELLEIIYNFTRESVVTLMGKVKQTPFPVKGCTIQNVEIEIKGVEELVLSLPKLPIQIDEDLNTSELSTRLDNRVLDLRKEDNQFIFRFQSTVAKIIRHFLEDNGFMEIHTPKLISTASEGGSTVFPVKYFDGDAYLAQSPQLFKQMAICADFKRVYEVGPVFRAENSHTHRHLTEFTGFDLEMEIENHYSEVLDFFEKLFIHLFIELEKQMGSELKRFWKKYNIEPFTFGRKFYLGNAQKTIAISVLSEAGCTMDENKNELSAEEEQIFRKILKEKHNCDLPEKKLLRIDFMDAICLLRHAGFEANDYDDLNTEQERALGKIIKEKYGTDFYMLNKFPSAVRPFYTMPDKGGIYSHSYDFFIRGEEILSGAQRQHNVDELEKSAKEHGIDLEKIQDYLDAFRYGVPPHGGGGIGLERLVMFYLGIGNVRNVSLFPRDPNRIRP